MLMLSQQLCQRVRFLIVAFLFIAQWNTSASFAIVVTHSTCYRRVGTLSTKLEAQQCQPSDSTTEPNANDVSPTPRPVPVPAVFTTPHAGCHFRPTHPATSNVRGPRKSKRFFEGWYYRITLPEDETSFAFIFSIEDPFDNSPLSLCCHQVMGPHDEYLVQADPDHTKFWALQDIQSLGCIFEGNVVTGTGTSEPHIDPEDFHSVVQSGFQMYRSTRLQGKLTGHDGSFGGVYEGQGVPGTCSYDLVIDPIAGWGDTEQGQKSTAGWLASYAVFEPHWQVTMADARATGTVTWKGKTYTFRDARFYAEKNWGGAFPIKWYWCQCNAFDGYADQQNTLSVTAGGGTRKIPLGQTESLGMVSVHYNGVFYEATPWLGDMEWHISPWGYWNMTGRCTGAARPFEVRLEATCDAPGVKLRAPTEKEGMAYFCRDSFLAHVTLSLWEMEWDSERRAYVRGTCLIDRATSKQAAVEVGGGPWWDDWKALSVMKQPMKCMVRLPYRFANLRKQVLSRITRKHVK